MNDAAKKSKPVFAVRLRQILLAGLAIYVMACVGCAMFQRRLIYFPPHQTPRQVDEAARINGLERWRDASGQTIGMKRSASRQPAIGRVLIVYGNGSWSACCAHYAKEIQAVAAFDVFILEYPGYADRAGSPSQKTLFQAADEAFQLLGTNQPLYLVGESLGSGVATYLAGTHPDEIAGIMLLSPYDQLTRVAQSHMPFLPVSLMMVDRFPSADYLRQYRRPVGIMVDGQDNVVPEKFGLALYDHYAGPKQLWRFPDGGHIAIVMPPENFWREVVDFWQTNRGLPK